MAQKTILFRTTKTISDVKIEFLERSIKVAFTKFMKMPIISSSFKFEGFPKVIAEAGAYGCVQLFPK